MGAVQGTASSSDLMKFLMSHVPAHLSGHATRRGPSTATREDYAEVTTMQESVWACGSPRLICTS